MANPWFRHCFDMGHFAHISGARWFEVLPGLSFGKNWSIGVFLQGAFSCNSVFVSICVGYRRCGVVQRLVGDCACMYCVC